MILFYCSYIQKLSLDMVKASYITKWMPKAINADSVALSGNEDPNRPKSILVHRAFALFAGLTKYFQCGKSWFLMAINNLQYPGKQDFLVLKCIFLIMCYSGKMLQSYMILYLFKIWAFSGSYSIHPYM